MKTARRPVVTGQRAVVVLWNTGGAGAPSYFRDRVSRTRFSVAEGRMACVAASSEGR